MKRILLALMLVLGTSSVFAQEKPAAAEKTGKEESAKDEMLVWKWGNFALLIILGFVLLKKPMPAFFKGRSTDIQKDITEAQATKLAAEKRGAEMDVRLSTLGAEIEKFKAQSKVEMAQESDRIRQETARHIEKLQKQAEQEIESAGTLASRELSAYAAKLALDLAEQRIRTRLDAATEAGLVDDFTKDLQGQGSKN